MSCNSGHGQSLPVANGFHSPTLICSDPKSLIIPLRLNPIEQSETGDNSRYNRSRFCNLSPDVSSRSYQNSPRGYEKPKTGGNDRQVKVARKKVRFAIPAVSGSDKSKKNVIPYDGSVNYCKTPETPWAAPLIPKEHVDIIYAPRSRKSKRWR